MNVEPSTQLRVAIVNAIAELFSLDKTDDIKDCSQLAENFTSRITQKYKSSDEVCLILHRYDLPSFLKTDTRVKGQAGKDQVYYRINNSTNIAKVRMRRLMTHTKTKNELTSYLAETFVDHAGKTKQRVVVALGRTCCATHQDVDHLQSDQEEADTKIMFHCSMLDAPAQCVTELFIHSPRC